MTLRWNERSRDCATILACFLASRAMLAVVGILTLVSARTYPGRELRDVWHLVCNWDCNWYLRIVDQGYATTANADQAFATPFAFFPLYPLMVRAVRDVTGLPSVVSGALLSNLLFLAALFVGFAYVRRLGFSSRVGLLAVALVCFVPHSFVFSAVYTESLYLLLSVGAMLLMRSGMMVTAGFVAALLAATRPNGIGFLAFAGAWIVRRVRPPELLTALRREPEQFAPLVLAPLGLFAYWWYSFAATGDAFAHVTTNRLGWAWALAWPWVSLGNSLGHPILLFWAITGFLLFAASLLLLRYRMYEEFLFCFATFLITWTRGSSLAQLRYAIVLFPIFVAVAKLLEDRPMATTIVFATMSVLSGFLMAAWTRAEWIAV